jgi:hypothetical protein
MSSEDHKTLNQDWVQSFNDRNWATEASFRTADFRAHLSPLRPLRCRCLRWFASGEQAGLVTASAAAVWSWQNNAGESAPDQPITLSLHVSLLPGVSLAARAHLARTARTTSRWLYSPSLKVPSQVIKVSDSTDVLPTISLIGISETG